MEGDGEYLEAAFRKMHTSSITVVGRKPATNREERELFWQYVAVGMGSEATGGASHPVGSRRFREAGGVPPAAFRPSAKPLSGRYLSLVEREEFAL